MFKQKINIPLYIIIFSCLFTLSLSQTEILDPYLIANDTIKINTYQSTLTDEQRSSYYYWIGFRIIIHLCCIFLGFRVIRTFYFCKTFCLYEIIAYR